MKKIALIGILTLMIGISAATEIRFSPDGGDIQNTCLMAADVMIDTDGKAVAATDVVIQSSLEYLDFVPNKESGLFPYFFPPKVKDNVVHIVGFIADPKYTVNGSGSIGKIFFKQKKTTDTDGAIRLAFVGKGQTYDSNLSMLGGIDTLDTVGSGYYRFLDDAPCQYPADYVITGGFSHMSAEDALNATIKEISHKQRLAKIFSRKNIVTFAGLLIIATFLFIYIKRKRSGKTK